MGLAGRPSWRTAMWLVVGGYVLVNLASLHATVLSLLVTLVLGRTIGLGVRYAAGSMSVRPAAEQIAAALSTVGCRLTQLRRGVTLRPGLPGCPGGGPRGVPVAVGGATSGRSTARARSTLL